MTIFSIFVCGLTIGIFSLHCSGEPRYTDVANFLETTGREITLNVFECAPVVLATAFAFPANKRVITDWTALERYCLTGKAHNFRQSRACKFFVPDTTRFTIKDMQGFLDAVGSWVAERRTDLSRIPGSRQAVDGETFISTIKETSLKDNAHFLADWQMIVACCQNVYAHKMHATEPVIRRITSACEMLEVRKIPQEDIEIAPWKERGESSGIKKLLGYFSKDN